MSWPDLLFNETTWHLYLACHYIKDLVKIPLSLRQNLEGNRPPDSSGRSVKNLFPISHFWKIKCTNFGLKKGAGDLADECFDQVEPREILAQQGTKTRAKSTSWLTLALIIKYPASACEVCP
jgi:hypothetical protein